MILYFIVVTFNVIFHYLIHITNKFSLSLIFIIFIIIINQPIFKITQDCNVIIVNFSII